MLVALFRAFGNLFAPALRRIVGLSLAIAMASFAGLWFTLAIVLDYNARFGWRPLDWLVDLLGALVALLVTWFLYPAVVTLVMGFFLTGSLERSRRSTIREAAQRGGRQSPRRQTRRCG